MRLSVGLEYGTWEYKTESGKVIGQDIPDTTSAVVDLDHSIQLYITWSNQAWHVKVDFTVINGIAFVPFTGDVACSIAQEMVNLSTNFGSTQDSSHTLVNWSFEPGKNRAAGCLGQIGASQGNQLPSSQPAYFLYRFGILLVANASAHFYFPAFPVADAYTQNIAQQIAAQIAAMHNPVSENSSAMSQLSPR